MSWRGAIASEVFQMIDLCWVVARTKYTDLKSQKTNTFLAPRLYKAPHLFGISDMLLIIDLVVQEEMEQE